MLRLVAIAIASFLIGCLSQGLPRFDWRPAIWGHSSKEGGVIRSGVIIKCTDPAFDEMVSVHKSEPRKAVEACQTIINQCERWKQK